jgi:hypothetical protein
VGLCKLRIIRLPPWAPTAHLAQVREVPRPRGDQDGERCRCHHGGEGFDYCPDKGEGDFLFGKVSGCRPLKKKKANQSTGFRSMYPLWSCNISFGLWMIQGTHGDAENTPDKRGEYS